MWGRRGFRVTRLCFRVSLGRIFHSVSTSPALSVDCDTMLRDELAQLRRLGIRHVRPIHTRLLRNIAL
jgi:hypothetical protein